MMTMTMMMVKMMMMTMVSYGADDDFIILSVRSYHPGCLAILLSLCGLNPLQSHAPPSTIIQGASNSRHLHHNHHLHHHHHHHHHHLYHNPGGIISFSFLRHNHNHHQSTMIHWSIKLSSCQSCLLHFVFPLLSVSYIHKTQHNLIPNLPRLDLVCRTK